MLPAVVGVEEAHSVLALAGWGPVAGWAILAREEPMAMALPVASVKAVRVGKEVEIFLFHVLAAPEEEVVEDISVVEEDLVVQDPQVEAAVEALV